VAEPDASGGVRTTASGFSLPYPPEYRSFRPNRPLLERASELSGGKAIGAPLEALRPVANPGASISELWALCLFAAALLLPFDVGVRRLALPLGELFAKLWARLRRRKEVPQTTQQVTVGRLQQAKQRAQTSTEPAERVVIQPEPPREAATPRATTATGNTSKSLLESKRKRKDG